MNILGKLFTAGKGVVTETGEAIIDKQAIRIMDQEIKDAKEDEAKARNALADMIAMQTLAAEDADKIRAQIAKYESDAVNADARGETQLFNDVCERIASLEATLAPKAELVKTYETTVAQFRKSVSQTEAKIARLTQELDVVKATEQVQRAQMQVADKFVGNNSSLAEASESLQRIKERQRATAAKLNAATSVEAGADDLDARLRAAGIGDTSASANSVAERLRAKKAAADVVVGK